MFVDALDRVAAVAAEGIEIHEAAAAAAVDDSCGRAAAAADSDSHAAVAVRCIEG